MEQGVRTALTRSMSTRMTRRNASSVALHHMVGGAPTAQQGSIVMGEEGISAFGAVLHLLAVGALIARPICTRSSLLIPIR